MSNTTDPTQTVAPHYAPVLVPEKGKWLIPLAYVCIALVTAVLLLRIWSRLTLPRRKFQADDWTAIASWPFVLGIPIAASWMMHHGFGRHVWEVPPGDLLSGGKVMYAGMFCYYTNMTLIRISATLFYRRAFGNRGRAFVFCIWANIVVNVLFWVALIPAAVSICSPVRAFWDKSIPNFKCRSTRDFMNSAGVIIALFDLLTLILPLPFVWNMQIPLKKKLIACGMFAMGYSVAILAIGRAIVMFRLGAELDKDVTWAFVSAKYWLDLETAVASISISLPGVFALFKRASDFGLAALFNDKEYRHMSFGTHGTTEMSIETSTDGESQTDVESAPVKQIQTWAVVVART